MNEKKILEKMLASYAFSCILKHKEGISGYDIAKGRHENIPGKPPQTAKTYGAINELREAGFVTTKEDNTGYPPKKLNMANIDALVTLINDALPKDNKLNSEEKKRIAKILDSREIRERNYGSNFQTEFLQAVKYLSLAIIDSLPLIVMLRKDRRMKRKLIRGIAEKDRDTAMTVPLFSKLSAEILNKLTTLETPPNETLDVIIETKNSQIRMLEHIKRKGWRRR